ncbi:hypothetical protein GOP47_0005260 [Adiantum capillus-veneris]|uniref:Probable zinc-ribbon domain-containing protein n=1 Tax=Adiantum capillus-veneris TaxID=13818 RepID=A0A9D4ZNF4_ADICA|nr:hypothetical protein GOP47_0005260 [Adiantum capillus-veneris]
MVALQRSLPDSLLEGTFQGHARYTKCSPQETIFECPICSCRLSANGVVASTITLSGQAKDREFEQPKAVNGSDGGSSVQEGSPMDECGTQQDTNSEVCRENRSLILKEEQQPVTQNEELHVVSNNHVKEAKPSINGTSEDLYENKDNEEMDSSSIANGFSAVNNELVLTAEESDGKGSASNKRLDLEMFRTSRCEFSFKYTLEENLPVELDSSRKRLPPSKFSQSVPNNEASDVPLCTPLRVRISNRCEESSDQSEHGRYSFSSETGTHDGSESDFDFPAPWADGLQDSLELPDSSGQNDLVQPHSKQAASATPHQLELRDVYDANTNEYVLHESSKHSEGSDTDLPLRVGVADHITSHPRKENEHIDNLETSSFDLSSKVDDLANIISSVTLDHDQNRVESLAATVSSSRQDPQFTPSQDSISAVEEGQSASHVGPLRGDIQATDLGSATEGDQKIIAGMVNDNPSSVLQGPLVDGLLSDPGKGVHTFIETHASDKDLYDHHLLQGTEMELDLYSYHKVDEWQHRQLDVSPSNAHYYTPIMENQRHYPGLQLKERHSSVFSDHATSSIPYVVANHHVSDQLAFGTLNSNQMYSYQVPLQPSLLPVTIHNNTTVAYHAVPNACMLCSHHQHPYMQNHVGPHCAVCLSHSGSMAWNSGHVDQWSCHQAHHGPFQQLASPLVACIEGPTNLTHRYDFPNVDVALPAYLSGKLSQYPPLPKDGAAPYVSCNGCSRVLQVPLDLPPTNGFVQKLQCSACGRVNKFSVKQLIKQQQVEPFLKINSVGGAANMLSEAQYNSYGILSCHDQHVHPGSSWQHEGSTSKTMRQVDANVFASRVSPLKPKDNTVDGYSNMGSHCLDTSSTMVAEHQVVASTHNARFERRRQDAVSSLNAAVDEKDEGLDFGAPRISDGDSFDQSESRMRSPEDIQAERTCAGVPEGVPGREAQAPGQVSKLDQSEESNMEEQEKMPGSPLLVLLNQESTRFRLILDPRAPSDEYKSVSCSPASDSPPIDNTSRNFLRRKERTSSQSRKGPKYIAGLLRRSLKDFSTSGQ